MNLHLGLKTKKNRSGKGQQFAGQLTLVRSSADATVSKNLRDRGSVRLVKFTFQEPK